MTGQPGRGHMGRAVATEGFTGVRWRAGRDLAEIAKDVRSDLKGAQRDGALPSEIRFSVRIDRYSMGQALDVVVKGHDKPVERPLDFTADHHGAFQGLEPEASAILHAVGAIVDAYQRSRSDVLTGYSNVEFFPQVRFAGAADVTSGHEAQR